MAPGNCYTYTKISDIDGKSPLVNVYGLVIDFKGPSFTSNGNKHLLVKLVDPENLRKPLPCNIFANGDRELPPVKEVGDIIRFHRLLIETYRGRLQGRNSKGFSWLLFHKDPEIHPQPLSSHDAYTLTDEDRKRVDLLKTYVQSVNWPSAGNLNGADYITPICELANGKFHNIIAQVVSVTFSFSLNRIMLTVWDGTCPKFNSVQWRNTELSTSDKLLEVAAVNEMVSIFVFDEHVSSASKLLPGKFVLLNNVHVKLTTDSQALTECRNTSSSESGHWFSLSLHSGQDYGRGVFPLEDSDGRVQVLREQLWKKVEGCKNVAQKIREIKRTSDGGVSRSLQESMTITEFPLQPFISISEVIRSAAPSKFRIRGKVILVSPSSILQGIVFSCHVCQKNICLSVEDLKAAKQSKAQDTRTCKTCKSAMKLTYLFRFLVEDSSSTMEVILFDEDAESFFNNVKPVDMLVDDTLRSWYNDKLTKLVDKEACLLSDDQSLDCPYAEICIRSYSTSAGTMYRLFGTSLA